MVQKAQKRNEPETYEERNCKMISFYGKLPNEMLAEFHYWITHNIKQNILSQEMHRELKYIAREMDVRGLTTIELYRYRIMEK